MQYHLMPLGNGHIILPVKAAIKKMIRKEESDAEQRKYVNWIYSVKGEALKAERMAKAINKISKNGSIKKRNTGNLSCRYYKSIVFFKTT